jgi:hypothetical protein
VVERHVVSLFIRPGTNKGYHILHLYVCSEINNTLALNNPAYRGKPGNPAMAILPMFEMRADTPGPIRQIKIDPYGGKEFILGEARTHGVSRPIPITSAPLLHVQMTSSNYIDDGNVAITRFDADDWPRATATITEMLREVLSRVVRRIDMGQ